MPATVVPVQHPVNNVREPKLSNEKLNFDRDTVDSAQAGKSYQKIVNYVAFMSSRRAKIVVEVTFVHFL